MTPPSSDLRARLLAWIDAAAEATGSSRADRMARALRGEVERHVRNAGTHWKLEWCGACRVDDGKPGRLYESWPCTRLTRIASHLGVDL